LKLVVGGRLAFLDESSEAADTILSDDFYIWFLVCYTSPSCICQQNLVEIAQQAVKLQRLDERSKNGVSDHLWLITGTTIDESEIGQHITGRILTREITAERLQRLSLEGFAVFLRLITGMCYFSRDTCCYRPWTYHRQLVDTY
jgi:hypothetical protein